MFDIDAEFDFFLKTMGIKDKAVLPDTQYQEMKKAFVGGISQLLIKIADNFAIMEQGEAVNYMIGVEKSVAHFWEKQLTSKTLLKLSKVNVN